MLWVIKVIEAWARTVGRLVSQVLLKVTIQLWVSRFGLGSKRSLRLGLGVNKVTEV